MWTQRLLWLLERPWVIWLALLPVAIAYTLPFLWGGDDVFEMAAAIRAASENLLDPRNPMLALPGETSPRFTPYVIFWGAVMKATGTSVFTMIKVTALANFLLFATGLTRFITAQFGDKRLATILIPVMLWIWGTGYGQANAYHLWFFFFSLPYVAIFAYGMGFHALAELALYLTNGQRTHVVLFAALSTLVFLYPGHRTVRVCDCVRDGSV
ncbi:MAG: hypothetical protein IPP40_11540 [bacterium]|nr:hypothetical protein [bacterium]